ncbi:myelin-oligodendrocyte glycoprotein-like [Cebidichthys violaceus]|uniref:myelin-oligodendrocyte glycoprotein-like n=1 Tax=Cebidichthys violaceus TaxID=271503 RepID=UPI0035CBF4CE
MSLSLSPCSSCLTLDTMVLPVPLWILSGLLSVLVCTGEGRSQLIGSSQPIVSAVGDDVILPCHVEPQLNVENLTVKWWKPDVPLDPLDPMSNYRYVHSYQNNRVEEDMQMESYISRTSLSTDDLKHGNISLKIKKVKLSDGGIYRCDIPQLFSDSSIILEVERTPQPENITTPHPDVEADVAGGRLHLIVPIPLAVFISLILIGGVRACLHKHRCQKQNV